jgi:hypothetical protein
MKIKKIAVIGGGTLGTLTALQLSNLGYNVSIFEKNHEILRGASYFGEAKIHLGYTYGLAGIFTIQSLLNSAFSFKSIFERALNQQIDWSSFISSPFVYKVDKESLISVDEFIDHANKISELIKTCVSSECYLNLEDSEVNHFKRISERNFATGERAIDVVLLNKLIKSELSKRSNISIFLNHKIEKLNFNSSKKYVLRTDHETVVEEFSYVINCTWDQRNKLDKSFVDDLKVYNYRTKLYVYAETNLKDLALTTVLGKFGDLVIFGNGRLYASDYYQGLTNFENGVFPKFQERETLPKDLVDKHWASCQNRYKEDVPSILEVSDFKTFERTIVAIGESDIDKIESELHNRLPFHVFTKANYISALATKYTNIPLLSKQIVDWVLNNEFE